VGDQRSGLQHDDQRARDAGHALTSSSVVEQEEAPYYAPAARLAACVVPGSGHDVSLHRNNWVQAAASARWSYRFVGQGAVKLDLPLPRACN
jgi:hypothetical protein